MLSDLISATGDTSSGYVLVGATGNTSNTSSGYVLVGTTGSVLTGATGNTLFNSIGLSLTNKIYIVKTEINDISTWKDLTSNTITTLSSWKNTFDTTLNTNTIITTLRSSITTAQNDVNTIKTNIANISANGTYVIIDRINSLFNRSCMAIMIEGEVDVAGNLLFTTSSGSYLNGSFGIPLPRASIIQGWSCISTIEENENITSLSIPIYLYNNQGVLNTSISIDPIIINHNIITKIFNGSGNGLNILLPILSTDGGNILSIGTPTVNGIDNPQLTEAVRFRILIEILVVEDYSTTYYPITT